MVQLVMIFPVSKVFRFVDSLNYSLLKCDLVNNKVVWRQQKNAVNH
jgi:hypothetical protein